jgi:hypothetical protein
MKSQVIRLNPPLNIGRRPEDGIGFTIRSYLMTPQEIRQRSEPIAEAEKAILADNGWTHRGFGYSCGRNRRIVPDEIGSDIERRALLPVWFLVFLFLGLPAFWTLRQIHVARSARFKTAGDRRAPTELCQGS